ncbi:MAG TPA: AMP-binding protein [Roseiarcus sp.]|nr:AMP-binding protein [Roseiarcus sp.]
MGDLDFSCGGLLPLIEPLEAAPAICDDRGDIWLTREQVRGASLGLAEKIASDRKQLVFLFCGANSETVIGLLAAAAAGHATALLDPSLAGDRLKGLIEAYQPDLILGTRDLCEKLRAVADNSADTRSLKSEGGVIEWIARDAPPSVSIDPALQLLLSTSGTTGSRKYVRLSRDAILANARQIARALAVGEESVGVAHLPLHYSYGLSILTSHLVVGGRIGLINDSITSPSFWSKIGRVGGTHFPGVPFHYAALARLGAGIVPNSVKVFTQAGGALDLRIQAKIHEWATLRGGQFFVMYGQTEASPRMTTLSHADFSRKAGSVGVALAQGRLSIVDDKGIALPADAVGAVVYEGANVMLGYAMERSDLAKGDEMKGRLETGDLGRLDGEGFLYLTGRAKRFAKIAGYRLGLDEIEQELTAVCPVACLDLGEKIAVAHEQEQETALKARVRELADSYKVPSSSFALRRIAQIPRGASGKIDYAQLKEALRV